MELKLNISTCPNDTFMFDALVNGRIDTEGLSFDLNLCDIEQLNNSAIEGMAQISKISYALYPQIKHKYLILNGGSALGRGNGPLLVSRHKIYPDELHDAVVAIPGFHTTANLLLSRLFPAIEHKRDYLFSDVAEVVMSNECDAGVLIHEGRFTYKEKGMQLIADLGIEWEKATSMPLPLGAIVVSRDIEPQIQKQIERLLKCSVKYALKNPKASAGFVKQYAQEISDQITAQHIELFVNQYSVDLCDDGRRAVRELLDIKEEEIFV